MQNIKKIVAITPCYNEPLEMIHSFFAGINEVKTNLLKKDVALYHFFLSDAAANLSEEYPILVRHKKNMGLAATLVAGYKAVFEDLRDEPDLIIRLDCQEHDPAKIINIVENFSHTNTEALFLPVWYWIKDQPRPAFKEVYQSMVKFADALNPMDVETLLSVYNLKFPLGYQAFLPHLLKKILPKLEEALSVFEKKFGNKATWGLDLLAIILAANESDKIDFMFGGWMNPWIENRGFDKINSQKKKASAMIEIAKELGCL